ncbi:MAG: hypothetical protein V3U99_00835 [Alphaproteobacteria bacterium]
MPKQGRLFALLRGLGSSGRRALAVVVLTAFGAGLVSPALAGQAGGDERGRSGGGLDLRITAEDLPSYRQETTAIVAPAAQETSPLINSSRNFREDSAFTARSQYRWQTGQPLYRGDELRPKTPGIDLFGKD